MTKIIVNSFARRQTNDSKFSHFAGSWEALVTLVQNNLQHAKPGYKDGVIVVPVPADGFFSGVVEVNETTELVATFEARRPDEAKFINITAKGQKAPAQVVEVILYDQITLGEDTSMEHADWEIISINASSVENEPMAPMAMARNFLGLTGGTKAEYTAEQFARSIEYWSRHAMRA